jgi:hypothetical protein
MGYDEEEEEERSSTDPMMQGFHGVVSHGYATSHYGHGYSPLYGHRSAVVGSHGYGDIAMNKFPRRHHHHHHHHPHYNSFASAFSSRPSWSGHHHSYAAPRLFFVNRYQQ